MREDIKANHGKGRGIGLGGIDVGHVLCTRVERGFPTTDNAHSDITRLIY